MISLYAILILLIIGPILLIGLLAWIGIMRLLLSICKRLVYQVVILQVRTTKIKKELKVLKEYVSFYTVVVKINMHKK